MKNIIVTIGEILLGVVIFVLIFGNSNSLRTEATRIFGDIMTQLNGIHS